MNLIQIGRSQVVNLDAVFGISFQPPRREPGGATAEDIENGVDPFVDQPARLYFHSAGPQVAYMAEGETAERLWGRIDRNAAADPPTVTPDRLAEIRGVMADLVRLGDRPGGGPLRSLAERLACVIEAIEIGL